MKPPTSPTIKLAEAALSLAQSELTGKGPDRQRQFRRALTDAIANVELMFTFAMTCSTDFDGMAPWKLGRFYEVTIGDMIERDLMGWLDEPIRRPYSIMCFRFLAEQACAMANESGTTITRDMLNRAGQALIDKFDGPDCPLPRVRPNTGFGPEGSACTQLQLEIRKQLSDMGGSSGPESS